MLVSQLVSELASQRTRRLSEPTFRPSRPSSHYKNIACRDSANISRKRIFFLRIFAL